MASNEIVHNMKIAKYENLHIVKGMEFGFNDTLLVKTLIQFLPATQFM